MEWLFIKLGVFWLKSGPNFLDQLPGYYDIRPKGKMPNIKSHKAICLYKKLNRFKQVRHYRLKTQEHNLYPTYNL